VQQCIVELMRHSLSGASLRRFFSRLPSSTAPRPKVGIPTQLHSYKKDWSIDSKVLNEWNENGYIIVKGLLNTPELERIKDALQGDQSIMQHAFDIADGSGRASKLALWNHPGSDITGVLGRTRRLVSTAESLLGGEVYHYHTKLMMKEAKTGGQFLWHQDYGYWYKNGCLFPQMLTAFIAIDPCTKENGCLQVLKGSHHLGRIEHLMVAGQTGADINQVKEIEKALDREYVLLNPGDTLFFHCNLLHKSDPNLSQNRRWAFLVAYNRASNNPFKKHHHPFFTPLPMAEDEELLACKNLYDFSGKAFMNPRDDDTIRLDAEKNSK